MLSTRTRYSIIALCDIARGRGGECAATPVSLVDIAEKRNLPLCYMEQLAVKWRKAGLVKGVRGPSGGYILKRAPDVISIADIAIAMDEAVSCGHDGKQADKARQAGCPAQRIFDLVTDQVLASLASITLADIACGRLQAEDSVIMGERPHAAADSQQPSA